MKEAVANRGVVAYATQYYNTFYSADANHTYEAVKEAKNILNPATLKAATVLL
mgnify:CR=1 FL=1